MTTSYPAPAFEGHSRTLAHNGGTLLDPRHPRVAAVFGTADTVIMDFMMEDRSYIAANDRERERLRALVEKLDDDALSAPVNEYWTVAGVLGHIAFWDIRVLLLADKVERGEPFGPEDEEPEGDWLNDATRPLIHAIRPRDAADLALRIAEETDARVARLPLDRLSPRDPDSPLYAIRAEHRGEHLDEIEAALRSP